MRLIIIAIVVILLLSVIVKFFTYIANFLNETPSNINTDHPIVGYIYSILFAIMIAILGWFISFISSNVASYLYNSAFYLLILTGIIFCLHIMWIIIQKAFNIKQ